MIVIGGSDPETYIMRPTMSQSGCYGGRRQRTSGARFRFAGDPFAMHVAQHGLERPHITRERLDGIIMDLIGRESCCRGDDSKTTSRCCPTGTTTNCCPPGCNTGVSTNDTRGRDGGQKTARENQEKSTETQKKESPKKEGENAECVTEALTLDMILEHMFGNIPRSDARCGGPTSCPTPGTRCDGPTPEPKASTSRSEEAKPGSRSGAASQEPQSRSGYGCPEPMSSSRSCAGRQEGCCEDNGEDRTQHLTLDKLIEHVFSNIFGEARQDRPTPSTTSGETCPNQPKTCTTPADKCPGQTSGACVGRTPSTHGRCCKETTTRSSPVVKTTQNQDQVNSDENTVASANEGDTPKSESEFRRERNLKAEQVQNQDHCHPQRDDGIKVTAISYESTGDIEVGESSGDIELDASSGDIELDESSGDIELGASTGDIELDAFTGDIDEEENPQSDTNEIEQQQELIHGDDSANFCVTFDMSPYAPDDIRVKQANDKLLVDATHEQVEGGVTSQSSVQKVLTLPPTVDPDTLRCRLGDDGHMTITAEYRIQRNEVKFLIVEK